MEYYFQKDTNFSPSKKLNHVVAFETMDLVEGIRYYTPYNICFSNKPVAYTL